MNQNYWLYRFLGIEPNNTDLVDEMLPEETEDPVEAEWLNTETY